MRQIRKIVRDKRGEGYIDVAVMVLCVMLVIALGVRLFPIFITKMQVDNFADELAREAEISGRVGSETSNRQRVLEERTGIHPTVQWSRTGNLQLNEEVTVTVTIQKDLMTIITRFTIVSGKDMPQAMSRMGNRFLPRWIMGIFTAECVFYSDWKRTGRDMFESITEERWSTV